MWEKIKKLFSSNLKRTAEKNGGVDLKQPTNKLDSETLRQSGFSSAEAAEDFDDDDDDEDDLDDDDDDDEDDLDDDDDDEDDDDDDDLDDDFDDEEGEAEAQYGGYRNTSDFCMIRPDAEFDPDPNNTIPSQSS